MKNKTRHGQTLVEVVVATMIAAMTSTAVFSVVLSSSVSGGRSDRKEAAALAMSAVSELLKLYVSAAPGCPGGTPNRYTLDCGKMSGIDTGAASGTWALAASATPHTIEPTFLTTNFPALANANPVMSYTVTNVVGCGAGTDATSCKEVTFLIQYDD